MKSTSTFAIAAVLLLSACGAKEAPLPEDTACHGGGYRLEDGRVVGMIPRDPGDMRYQFVSGETGGILRGEDGVWHAENGEALSFTLSSCNDEAIIFNDGKTSISGTRIPYTVTETIFDGYDGKRAGRLVLPTNGPTKAIVVSVHGSERWSGRTGGRMQTVLPAFGIGVFAYDKRGTGASDGKYTQRFDILSDDAVLAKREALRLYGEDVDIGYLGGSQGGWVAPLAASKDGAAFVIAAYGLAHPVAYEDEEEVVYQLREAGYDEEVIAKAREVTAATREVVFSNFKEGFKDLNVVREKYKDEPWFTEIEGEFSGRILNSSNIGLRIVGPFLTGDGGTPLYEPRPVLESLEMPQLWILAEKDTSAPSGKTLEILKDIQKTNDQLDVVVFPNTDHGMVEFTQDADGNRTYTKVTEGYYPLVRDFILTRDPTPSVKGPMLYRNSAAPSDSAPSE